MIARIIVATTFAVVPNVMTGEPINMIIAAAAIGAIIVMTIKKPWTDELLFGKAAEKP